MPERHSWTRLWEYAAKRHPWAVLCMLPTLALAIFCTTAPAHGLLTPDSPGYLYFTAGRPAGYPAFLWLVRHITGFYGAVRCAQAALYCAAALWLGAAAREFSASLIAALALQALLLAYPAPLQLADEIMADSLSATMTVLFAAQALRIAVAPSLCACAAAAALAGLGALVRPDNVALFPAALLLCACAGAAWFKASGLTLTILAVSLGVTPLAQWTLHGSMDGDHRLGREVMQKALFLPAAAAGAHAGCDADYIDSVSAPLIAYWRAAPADFQDVLRLRMSNLLRYGVIIPGLAARHGLNAMAGTGPMLMCYALQKAQAAPGAMVLAMAREYRNLILNYTFVGSDWRRGYTSYIQAHPPPLPASMPLPAATLELRRRAAADVGLNPWQAQVEAEASLSPPTARNRFAAWSLNAVQLTGCYAAWVFIVLTPAMLARNTALARCIVAAGALGLALQLHLLAIAAIEIAEPRYVFPLWPLFLVPTFMAAVSISVWQSRQHRS